MALYEIERKFVYNIALFPTFCQNKGVKPFRSLIQRNTEIIKDEYFDFSFNQLMNNGIYIRKRNDVWEAKQRRAGDFIRSSFYETNDIDEIRELVHKYSTSESANVSKPSNNFGLNTICRYLTTRENWSADSDFAIMLDTTDFGHAVGEVELQAGDEKAAMDRIDDFMERYKWFFGNDKSKPKGKMTAYFDKFGFPSKSSKRTVRL